MVIARGKAVVAGMAFNLIASAFGPNPIAAGEVVRAAALLAAASAGLAGCGGSSGGAAPVTARVEVRLDPFAGEVRSGDVLDFGVSPGASFRHLYFRLFP